MKKLKKLFGGFDLTWKKLIIFSLITAVYTALMAIIPQLKYTSFNTITSTLEVWILFGIFIIMNSKSNKDAALKCFVFFLISQPLIYLLQVPFSWQGWNLFQYYKFWLAVTLLCLPMGYIGYYLKKDKWYSYLILLPMIGFLLYSYYSYLTVFTFNYPFYSLIAIYCAASAILFPLILFNNKKIKMIGSILSVVVVVIISIIVFMNPYVYSTNILSNIDGVDFNEGYKVEIEDKKIGDVYIDYLTSAEAYLVHCDFKHNGKTVLIITTPEGEKIYYDLVVYQNTYDLEKKQPSR